MTNRTPHWQITLPRLMAALGLLCVTLASLRAFWRVPGFAMLSGSLAICMTVGVFLNGRPGFATGFLIGITVGIALDILVYC